jgi:hypothetical protein
MGKLDAFSMSELDLFFLSNDHRPPHIHVRKPGEWEVRVYFLESSKKRLIYDVKWSTTVRTLTKIQEKQLIQLIRANRDSLIKEWDEKVCTD